MITVAAGAATITTAFAALPIRAEASQSTNTISGYSYKMSLDADFSEQYYTNASQQSELALKIDEVCAVLDLWNASDYDKARVLYEFITQNVKYDYGTDANDMLKYTAYGAMTRKRAVCQGFSTLYYMMGKKIGLDAPVVIGTTSRGRHAWNVVRIDGQYYGLDAAWDSVYRDYGMDYRCFLKGESSFDDHVLDEEYRSGGFRAEHPLSPVDYDPANAVYNAPTGGTEITVYDEPSYTETAYEGSAGQYSYNEETSYGDAGRNNAPDTVESFDLQPVTKFADVGRGDYYAEAVSWAVESGITSGVSESFFAPGKGCTRAELVTFLYKALNNPPSATIALFEDVSQSCYYAAPVNWASEAGITSGTGNGFFGSGRNCTRAEAMTILWRAAGSAVCEGNAFSDVANNAYYRQAANWAVSAGITSGTGNGTFSPNETCTRAQIVIFLYRYLNG